MTGQPAGTRQVVRTFRGMEVIEGAGVRLRRFIGGPQLDYVDPFLLLDEFKSDNPGDYIAGFPWHPHRGIETVTYMIQGQVRHGDSIGNHGLIGPGDVQWMTAGHGIIHEEMPEQRDGLLWGFQLWVNLPARAKMCDPRYQDLPAASVPLRRTDGGASVRVIAGEHFGARGPVTEILARPSYLDLHLPPRCSETVTLPPQHTVVCHIFDGEGQIGDTTISAPTLAVLGQGEGLKASAGDQGLRLLIFAGQALDEPVARGGPFVMNTPEEIMQAFQDYRDGTLLKK